jgi:hypothetical protein
MLFSYQASGPKVPHHFSNREVIFRSAKWAHRVLVLCIARLHIYLASFSLQLFHVGRNFRAEQ